MTQPFRNIFLRNKFLFRLIFFLIADAVLIIISVYLAFFVRFEGDIPAKYDLNIPPIIFLTILITIPVFYFSKLYHFTWLYVSTGELVSLMKAVAFSFFFLTTTFFFLREHPVFTGFPRSTLFITYFFIFIFSGGIRFSKRIYLQTLGKEGGKGKERTLIIGAGVAGEQLSRNILGSGNTPYSLVGFIDDDSSKHGILIHGLKVLGGIEDIPKIVKDKKVDGLIVALPSVGSQPVRRAVEQGRKAGLRKIRILPSIDEVISGKIRIGAEALRELEMEDLLGREPASLDKKLIEKFISGERVLVTGAAGSIGSELCRQIIKFNPQLLFVLDQDETGIFNIENELKESFSPIKSFVADVRDAERIGQILKESKPDIIFHAAAYKHVPLMEENASEAVKNNILGTKVLADLALDNNIGRLIFISTDKAVSPTSVMGATKRMGEMICQTSNQKNSTKFISVRFGNVLGSRGSVIPIFREQIKKGGPVEITHSDMKRYFMTTPEACLLVMEAGAMGEGGEVFVLDMGDPIKIVDLARELIRLSGFEPDKDIPIVFTDPRPGEKFSEELLSAEEGTIATKNEKIFRAKLSEINSSVLEKGIEKLKEVAQSGAKEDIVQILEEVIPTFKSNNL